MAYVVSISLTKEEEQRVGWGLPAQWTCGPAHRPQRQATLVFPLKANCLELLCTRDV